MAENPLCELGSLHAVWDVFCPNEGERQARSQELSWLRAKTGKVCANKSGIMMSAGDVPLSLGASGKESDCVSASDRGLRGRTQDPCQMLGKRQVGPLRWPGMPLPEPVQSDKSTFTHFCLWFP